MMDLLQALYLTDILHLSSQALLAPVIVLLLLFLAYALFLIGSIIVEAVTERRVYRMTAPPFLAALTCAGDGQVADVVAGSGLLRRQKVELLTLWAYRALPPDALEALAKRLLAAEELRYARTTGRTDAAVRLAPMLGLMGTLIPLGPGIVALGQSDTTLLAQSIGVAFDTTVAGLAAAAVAYVVGRIRKNWYEDYLGATEAALSTLLEKAAGLRETGTIVPCDASVDLEAIVTRATQEMRAAGASAKELAAVVGPDAQNAGDAAGAVGGAGAAAEEA